MRPCKVFRHAATARPGAVPCRSACVAFARSRGGGNHFGEDSLFSKGGAGGMGGMGGLGGNMPGLGDMGGLDLGGMGGSPSGDDPLNYDPEGLFKGLTPTTLQDGHITRRAVTKNAQTAEEMEAAVKRQQEAALAEAQARRDATTVPDSPTELVDFFLNCDAADMEYFVARTRARLGRDFFAALDGAIGTERFLPEPNEERLAELEGLRAYIEQLLAAQEKVTTGIVSATERLKRLLTAPDKKQCILDMAAANEIDVALISLLQQNIDGAEAAGQAQAAAFMTKVRDACSKYVITPARPSEEDRAKRALQEQQQQQQQQRPQADAPKLIMPN